MQDLTEQLERPPKPVNFRGYLPVLDCLRGLASLWVVLFHINEMHPIILNRVMVRYGWLGVPIFFVISGYCIALALRRQQSAGVFLWRRLWRIYPPYLASIVVVLLVVGLHLFTKGANNVTILPHSVGEILATLTLLTAPATSVHTVNWVYWSLTYEVIFYFVTAISLSFGRYRLAFFIFLGIASFYPGIGKMPVLFFLGQWPLFGLGLATWYFCESQNKSTALLLVILVAAIFHEFSLSMACTATGISLLIYLCYTFQPPDFLFPRPFRYLGDISYSLYLTHVPIGCFVMDYYFNPVLMRTGMPSPLRDLIIICVCILFAAFFYTIIERPAHRFARNGVPAQIKYFFCQIFRKSQ
ncbi:MAG: acyltransferase [Chthoniobacterales bacterium]